MKVRESVRELEFGEAGKDEERIFRAEDEEEGKQVLQASRVYLVGHSLVVNHAVT